MRRYLVVANQTLGGEELLACVRDRRRAGPRHFHVLVPATPADQLDQEYVASVPEHVRAAAERQPGDDDRLEARALLEDEAADIHGDRPGEELGRALARDQLREALTRIRALGADLLLSTLPGRRSRWLATDLPSRIRRTYKLPVTQVTGPAHAGPARTTKE